MSVFTVEIMRPGNFGLNTSATLEMPATWAEYQDAKEKARITDDRVIYSSELLHCEHDWLRPHIPENANLLELNLLAVRMEKYIKDDLDVFEAMVKAETGRNNGEPLPMQKLINMTFSTENCHVVDNITSDALLGKFLFDNDFFTDEDANAVQARIDTGRPVSALLTELGKEHRESNGGVQAASGRYVEYDGSINEVYVPHEMVYFDRTGAPVVLTVSKGHFNDPDYDNDREVTLNLPAADKAINNAFDYVDAKSEKEIAYRCEDCLIPAAKEWLDEAQDFEQANDFAETLHQMERQGGVVEYKALLEAAECGDLDTALRLTDGIDEYNLAAECAGPEDFAKTYVDWMMEICESPDISSYFNLYPLGEFLMKHENAVNTSYGVLQRKDGGPILSQTDAPGTGMTMGGINQ